MCLRVSRNVIMKSDSLYQEYCTIEWENRVSHLYYPTKSFLDTCLEKLIMKTSVFLFEYYFSLFFLKFQPKEMLISLDPVATMVGAFRIH